MAATLMDFRPLAQADLPLLLDWLRRPHVAQWWQPEPSLAELEQDYLSGSSTRAYIALLDGEPLGFIQSYVARDCGGGWWEQVSDPGRRGIDQFLADGGRLGQGLGSRMVRAFVDRLFEDPAVTSVQTDPSPDNARAIRCYRRAGFVDQGVIDTPDGPALLMLKEKAMTRQRISSGSSFEAQIGYSRALVAGDWVFVSGTTGFDYSRMAISEDVVEQAAQCLRNIESALAQAGSSLADVVRVHYILPDASQFEPCWPVLRQAFGEIGPAATMLSAGLADPRMKIEIEVTALKQGGR